MSNKLIKSYESTLSLANKYTKSDLVDGVLGQLCAIYEDANGAGTSKKFFGAQWDEMMNDDSINPRTILDDLIKKRQKVGRTKAISALQVLTAIRISIYYCVLATKMESLKKYSMAWSCLCDASKFLGTALGSEHALDVRQNAISDKARSGGLAKHARSGIKEKKQKIVNAWLTGKYTSRAICAEQEAGAIGLSFDTARKALINTPDPKRVSL